MTKLVVALAASLLLAPASAAGADRLPDAEVFAASTTEVITDPADPRLDVRLVGFRRQVAEIVRRGGGRPRGSELLDGVFFSSPVSSFVVTSEPISSIISLAMRSATWAQISTTLL